MQRLGIWSASALFVVGLVYIIVVASARISGGGYTNPIGDPLLSVREALTLLGVPLMVYLLSVLFGREQNAVNRQPMAWNVGQDGQGFTAETGQDRHVSGESIS